MKLYQKLIFTAAIFIFSATLAMAQPLPPDDADVPIDGGISLLAAAGLAYGVKKYRDHHLNQKLKN